MDWQVIASLSAVAIVAGFVDSIAGGGGLLALPSLILSGLDPVSALATNKLQGTFGTAAATHTFWRKGRLAPRQHLRSVVMVFIGACAGVYAVSYAPTQLLTAVMPVLLIAIAVYFALSPHLSNDPARPRLPARAFSFAIAPALGFYDGVFGPGTGSFFMLALVSLFGLGMIEATGRTKLFNFTSNIASLLMFALGGKIVWSVGLAMGVGQVIGAQIGSRLAIRNGAKIIRPILIVACLAMAAKLLAKPDNPLWTFLT